MVDIQINDRVGVILKTVCKNNKRICYFLGYGIYAGKEIPNKKDFNKRLKKLNIIPKEHCKFVMDDGNIYYDYNTWVLSEERFKKVFVEDEYKEGWIVFDVDIKGKRRNINGK